MFDMEARHMIEALRSGIPSKAVGRCFSEARPKILKEISGRISSAAENGKSSGMVITGKYGEGKTHLLNTAANIAESQNMAVSYLSLSKESPMDKLYLVYPKLITSTFLPQRKQPGFAQDLDKLTANSPAGAEMLDYTATQLETNKLHFLLRAFFSTDDPDEKFQLLGDLEGDFVAVGTLKKIHRRIFNQPAKLNTSFVKTRHCTDYLYFMSHLFVQMGYNGWVILFDETELMGRLGKKARMNAYKNMAFFLMPPKKLESVFTLFALSASYEEDVIEGKHEFETLALLDEQEPIKSVLDTLVKSPQLLPLTRGEIREVFGRIRDFHAKAYNWEPQATVDELMDSSMKGGFLLRTRIRAAIEYLDQLYQYGSAGKTTISKLDVETLEDVPSLEEL